MTLMHRSRFAAVGRPRHAVTLGAQLLKDLDHCRFGGVDERPLGHFGRVLQKLLGLGHFFSVSAAGLSMSRWSWVSLSASDSDG